MLGFYQGMIALEDVGCHSQPGDELAGLLGLCWCELHRHLVSERAETVLNLDMVPKLGV